MKYIMCKLLQDKSKSESILKRLRSQTSREIGERLMTTTKTEAWTLLRQESQLYIAEDNKDADGSMDSIIYKTIRTKTKAWTQSDEGSKLYALIHEARIRRELIL